MKFYERLKDYFVKRGMKKNINDLISIFIIGLIVVITANFFYSQNKKPSFNNNQNTVEAEKKELVAKSYEDKVKDELTEILGNIDGAGKVLVMINFDSGGESFPAFNTNNSTRVTEENDGDGGKRITNESNNSTNIVNTTDGGINKPFITKEIKPKINGVIVISEGAADSEIKYKLYEAVKTVFNLEQCSVNVYPMQKK